MFVGMSKREFYKAIEGMEIERISYYETKHQIPNEIFITFKEGLGRYHQKHFWLKFDKHSRRIAKEW